jgi:hypothetical protein
VLPPCGRIEIRNAERAGAADREAVKSLKEATEVGARPLIDVLLRWRAGELPIADADNTVTRDQVEAWDLDREPPCQLGQERDLALEPLLHFGTAWEANDPFAVEVEHQAVPAILYDPHIPEVERGEVRPEQGDRLHLQSIMPC